MSDTYPFAPGTLPQYEPPPEELDPLMVDMGDDMPTPDEEGLIQLEDGGVFIPDEGGDEEELGEPEGFDDNLAKFIPENELNKICTDLLRGIDDDWESSSQWRNNYSEGIKLLGTIIEPSSTDAGTATAQLEGQHKTTHPLMLEACLLFQANARASLLPASGPVKVRDDQTMEPDQPPMPEMMGHNGGPPLDDGLGSPGVGPSFGPGMGNGEPPAQPAPGFWNGGHVNSNGYSDGGYVLGGYADGGAPQAQGQQQPQTGGGSPININVGQQGDQQQNDQQGGNQDGSGLSGMSPFPPVPQAPNRDILAAALEKDFNHYLGTTAQEYYPDTNRMLFNVGLSGSGIKKVYNCPLRRRPVSESVPIEDFVVSNAFTDLSNMPRITQKITMRPSILRRMQLVGAYREVDLAKPSQTEQDNEVKEMKADVMGVTVNTDEPEDMDYELLECYCELELDQFAPEQFQGKGLALPYKVTIAREAEKILEIRRNWREDDKECTAKEFFVDFTYVKAFGFYGLGLMNILGNITRTLTAAWREFIDSGMFANFPGFVYAKGAGRQLTNQFRVPPGGGVGLDVGLADIRNAVMPLPYKDLGPAFVAFIASVQEYGQRLGGSANIQIGEGKQDAPVGTTLALIEQATKPLGAVLKGLHSSQSKEFQLLKDRFKEDPEAFWRFNRKPAMPWQQEQFMRALDDFDLVPVSDPNNPTNMHRLAKASIIQQVATAAPDIFDIPKVAKRIFEAADIDDIDGLFKAPGPPQPNPEAMAAQAMMLDAQGKAQAAQQKMQFEPIKEMARLKDREAERVSRETIAGLNLKGKEVGLAATLAINSDDQELQAARLGLDATKAQGDHTLKRTEGETKAVLQHNKTQLEAALKHRKIQTDADVKRETAKQRKAI